MSITRSDNAIERAVRLVLFALPIIYVAGMLCTAVHEVLGHGLSAVLFGGQFSGFTVKWDGMGEAFANLPAGGTPAVHQIFYWSSGIIATTLCGIILWGLIFFFHKRPDIQLALLVGSFIFLIDGIGYIVWNAYYPVPSADVGALILFSQALEFPSPVVLRWFLVIMGALLYAGTTFYFCTLIFVRVEALVLNEGQFTGKSRLLALFFFLVLPGAYEWLSFDWNQVAPDIGHLPNVAGTLSILTVATLLFWYRPKWKNGCSVPLITWRHLTVSGICLIVTVAALALWLNDGLIWSPVKTDIQDRKIVVRIDGPTPSPDGRYVAFSIMKENAQVGVLDLQSGFVRTISVPGKFVVATCGMSWNPDGTFLVASVVEEKQGSAGPYSLWSLSWPDAQWRKLIELPGDMCEHGLVSPRGDSILFRAGIAGDLKCLDLNSGLLKGLTETGDVYRFGYAWLPDGNQIYFSRGYMREDGGFWIMLADGTNKTLVFDDVRPNALTVSAMGQHVALTTVEEWGNTSQFVLYVATLPGFDKIRISSSSIPPFPRWNPVKEDLLIQEDGYVKVWSVPEGNAGVPSVRQITVGSLPVWAESGRTIVFRRNRIELWVYNVRTGEQKKAYFLNQ
ncbi:MAG: hypothetical protein A2Z25_06810 [Planctomycetes bacterium RBG_16_55_9]|nr:MAG: hypothetical protein A2Z25_06810 [Planctomycetes bacterium RBG_16_55_9]